MNATAPDSFRCGLVALGGRTNVGKSTLLNRLVGRKVSIVTPRPQTTRRRVLGVRHEPDAQLLLVDMPGLHLPRGLLNQQMTALARRCLAEADVLVGVIEAGPALGAGDKAFLTEMLEYRMPKVIAINKIDRVKRLSFLPVAQQCAQLVADAEIVPISALTGENVDRLVEVIKRFLPHRQPLMAQQEYTDQSELTIAQEIIREKIFFAVREEVPFSTAVKIDEFTFDTERELLRITATIVVERESQKGILIGAGGLRLKQIGQSAREELEALFNRRIFLTLFVKVDKNWTRDPRKVAELAG
jgi:GTP-binding protein Era